MRNYFLVYLLLVCCGAIAQPTLDSYNYEPNEKHPFGRLNPDAAPQTADYAPLIGINYCKSLTRNADGEWKKDSVDVIWRFKYIMNGLAVQDESLKADGSHTSSIRLFDKDADKWYVTFFSSAKASPTPSTWTGGNVDNEIILYNEQKAPNGMDGFHKITFHDISSKGFNWKGEWVNTAETFSFPTWYLTCKKK